MPGVHIIVELPGEPAVSRVFRQLPVRIGRNSANELCLPQGYVSEWHAIVRESNGAVELVDLGSTNGIVVDDVRLPVQQPRRIDRGLRAMIGPLTLVIEAEAPTPAPRPGRSATEAPPPPRDTPGASVETPRAGGRPHAGDFAPPTLFGESPVVRPPASQTPWPGDVRPPTLFGNPAAPPHPPPAQASPLPPARRTDAVPPVAATPRGFAPPTLFGMQEDKPVAPVSPAVPRIESPPSVAGEVIVPAARAPVPEARVQPANAPSRPAITPAPPQRGTAIATGEVAAANDEQARRMRRLLEAFCEAVVSLRRGLEQAGQELGVRTINGRSPVQTAREGGELLRALMDFSVDVEQRRRELLGLFQDFSSHHVAVMAGVHDGARALVTRLDPAGFDIEKGPRFMPILDRDNWRRFVETFQALSDDHELHEALFGAEFAQSYAAAAGGRGSDDR